MQLLGQGQRNVQAFSPASPGGKHPINVLWEHAATSQRGQGKLGEKVSPQRLNEQCWDHGFLNVLPFLSIVKGGAR